MKMMIKSYVAMLSAGIILAGLSACSSLPSSNTTNLTAKRKSSDSTAQLSCTGVSYCQFERVDNIQLVNPDNDWLTRQALSTGIVNIKDTKLKHGKVTFDLTISSQQHEVSVKFYPVSEHRAEHFTIIHNFQAGQNYRLVMYRQRVEQASLLEVSTPDPLCVDLQQGEITIRRFCRTHDAMTGFGEFVEQQLQSKGKV